MCKWAGLRLTAGAFWGPWLHHPVPRGGFGEVACRQAAIWMSVGPQAEPVERLITPGGTFWVLPAPADPLQAEGNLPTCPRAQLCALDTPARGRRHSSALGFCSHARWGAIRASGCGVSVSGSQRGDSSSRLSQTDRVPHRSSLCVEVPGLMRRGEPAKPQISLSPGASATPGMLQ